MHAAIGRRPLGQEQATGLLTERQCAQCTNIETRTYQGRGLGVAFAQWRYIVRRPSTVANGTDSALRAVQCSARLEYVQALRSRPSRRTHQDPCSLRLKLHAPLPHYPPCLQG